MKCPEDFLIETPPAKIADLSEVSDDAADCYRAAEGGGFELMPEAKEQIDAANADIQRVWAEGQAKLAEQDRKIERLRQTLDEGVKRSAIKAALVESKVKRKLLDVGTDYLVKHLAGLLGESDGVAV